MATPARRRKQRLRVLEKESSVRQRLQQIAPYLGSAQGSKLRLLTDALPVLISYIDPQHRYLFLNKGYEKWFVVPRREMTGKSVSQVIGVPAYKHIKPLLDKALKGKSVSAELWLSDYEEARHYVTVSFIPDKDPAGVVHGCVSLISDITSRKEIEDRQRFLMEASEVLAGSLKYTTTLASVAKLAVVSMADWCIVDVVSPAGKIERLAVTHKNTAKVKWALKVQQQYPPDPNAARGVPYVIKTGKSELYKAIPDEMLAAQVKNKKQLKLLRQMGLSSVIIVPMKIRQRVLGAITFVAAESGHHYNKQDLRVAEQLGRYAALAIENSLLYARSQEEVDWRTQAQQELTQQKTRLDTIVKSIPGLVWEASGSPNNPSQNINFVSEYVTQMLGYSVNEWLKTPNFWLKIVHADDRERAAAEAAQNYKRGGEGQSRFRWVKKNGQDVWVEAHTRVVKNAKGKAIGMRGVVIDISELKRLEQRKDDFITIASHELKTPITTLKLFTQVLAKRLPANSAVDIKKPVERINSQLDRLTKLINDLLDVSKIQAGKLEFNYQRFDINELVHDVVDTMQRLSDTHAIQMNGTVSRNVTADRDRIEQVLINLLTNALKYSPEANRVVVHLSSSPREITVAVQDFGIGIPASEHDKIFGRFYRGQSHSRDTYPGLGIGLYISAQIIARHGGKVWVESKKNKGSTFFFSLPVTPRKSRK